MDRPESDQWFEALVRDTHHALRSAIAGMGVPVADVDDVAQEVYVDFARERERMPAGIEARRWLLGMARNCSYEYFRRRRRHHQHLIAIAEALAQDPAAATDADEEPEPAVLALRACLGRLRPEQRALLEAHYRDGQPIRELARLHQRLETTMHMIVARLRDVLRRCLRATAGEAP